MHAAVMERAQSVDVFVAAAAVADYAPCEVAETKLKNDAEMSIALTRNPDILAGVSALSTKRPFTVGFAQKLTTWLPMREASSSARNWI